MCDCDYDRPDVYSKRLVVSKKERTCYECGRTIREGERYEYTFGVWYGKSDSFHTCTHCRVAHEIASAIVGCRCHLHGGLLNDLWNYERSRAGETSKQNRVLQILYGRANQKWQRGNGSICRVPSYPSLTGEEHPTHA